MTDDPHPERTTSALQLPMDVQSVGDDLVIVAVRGDIDLSEAGELRAVLNDASTGPHRTVAVDLSGVRFIGSTGMGVLAELHQRLATRAVASCCSNPPRPSARRSPSPT